MRTSARLPAVVRGLPAVVLALLVSGCAGSDAPESPAASAAPTPLTEERAAAVASASLLTEADLPGYTGAERVSDDTAATAALERCLGREAAATRVLAEAKSQEISKGGDADAVQVQSETQVVKDAATAAADLAVLQGPEGARCLEDLFDAQIGTPGASTSEPLQVSTPPGAQGAFGHALTITVTDGKRKATFPVEVVGAVAGSAEVQVSTFAVAEPLPAAERDRLLALAVERAVQAQAG